jgi:hypothetical protein
MPEKQVSQKANDTSPSQSIALANPCTVPRVMRWADASDEVVDMATRLLGPNISLSWLDNLQNWRSSTESAKGDEIMSRRVENASWRLWASGADHSLCVPDFLLELDKKDLGPRFKLTSSLLHSGMLSEGRGRQPQDFNPSVKIEEFCDARPSVVLHNWRVSTKQTKVVVSDGQARSRRENQLWRLMAVSRTGDDAKFHAIIQKVCAGNPTLALKVGAQSPAAQAQTLPVSRTPSPGGFASHPSSSDVRRSWFRTPSPECHWAADSRPVPILAPRVPANGANPAVKLSAREPLQNEGGYTQFVRPAENHGCYMQPIVAVPMPQPISQVVGLIAAAPFQSGVHNNNNQLYMQPAPAIPTMAVTVPVLPTAMSNSAFPGEYVCIAIPKHLASKMPEETSRPRH